MDETKTQTPQATNTPKPEGSTINLSNFPVPTSSKPATPVIAPTPVVTPVTPAPKVETSTFNLDNIKKDTVANTSTQTSKPVEISKPTNNGLNIESLKIMADTKDTVTEKSQVLSTATNTNETAKKWKSIYLGNMQLILTGYMIIFVATAGGILAQMYKNYITYENIPQVDEANVQFISQMQSAEIAISKFTKLNDFANRVDQTDLLTTNPAKDTIVSTLKNNSDLNYTQKKVVLQKNINVLEDEIISNKQKVNSIKSEIEKYGFIPKELYEMTQKQEGIDGIRRSMLLTENMKYITAFKVFGYLQSFIQGFANDSNMSAQEAETQLKKLNDNGEKDIIIYTNNCYFNPYEIGDDCSITNDFDKYYSIMDTQSDIKPDFLKKLASYVDRKLKEKELPSYTITFPEFNPKQDTISFDTIINTNRQDELALNKIGVINPHLYIITNLINTLKQSLLVIGENIKVDQIKIVPKTVRVGSTIFNINNSTLEFKLPIQKTNQREISDFFSNQSVK